MHVLLMSHTHTVFVHKNHKTLQQPKNHSIFLNNSTCYNKIICFVLFSSRWWVCWYKLFSVLAHCKMAKFWWNAKSEILKTNFGYYFTIIMNIELILSEMIWLYHVQLLSYCKLRSITWHVVLSRPTWSLYSWGSRKRALL